MIDKNDTQKKYEEWYKENAERVFGQSEIWKTLQRNKETDRKEEQEKRKEIEFKEKHDLFRNIDQQAKVWIEKYLSLSGVMRNQYNQIVDTCKRLSAMQISHILKGVHNYDVSPEIIGKYKRFLIKEGLLKTDEEFEKERPSEKELELIRQTGARATSIELGKKKEHLDPKELEGILEKQKEEEKKDIHSKMRELRRRIEENGYCPTEEELQELEDYEESREED